MNRKPFTLQSRQPQARVAAPRRRAPALPAIAVAVSGLLSIAAMGIALAVALASRIEPDIVYPTAPVVVMTPPNVPSAAPCPIPSPVLVANVPSAPPKRPPQPSYRPVPGPTGTVYVAPPGTIRTTPGF